MQGQPICLNWKRLLMLALPARNDRRVGKPRELLSHGNPSNLPYAVGDLLLRVFLKCPQCFVTCYQLKKIGAGCGAPQRPWC